MQSEYPEHSQRVAVCMSQWRRHLSAAAVMPDEIEQTVLLDVQELYAGADASAFLESMKADSEALRSIDASPNAHLIAFDLTTLDRPSRHQGATKYQLSSAGIAAALPTLFAKPIHVTANYDAHFVKGQPPKAVGVILGGVTIKNADGTSTLRCVGSVFNEDYPDVANDLRAQKSLLGASYEVRYYDSAAKRLPGGVLEISAYQFAGAAILKRSDAAHPETQLLAADRDGAPHDSKGEPLMAQSKRYPGITEDLEGSVELLIAQAVGAKEKEVTLALTAQAEQKLAEAVGKVQADAKTAADAAAKEMQDMKDKCAEAEAAKVAAEAAKATAETALADATAKLEAAQTKLDAIEFEKKLDAEWKKLQAAHKLPDSARAEKAPILTKILQGQALTVDEATKLTAGSGAAKTPGNEPLRSLAASGEPDGKKDPEKTKRAYPEADLASRQKLY